jgi:flagellin
MAISILNNIASLEAQNQLSLTQSELNNTLNQLSSGSRINTGADDAAGLAIANGLEANITALTQSAQNANSGVGSLQVADGALAQVTTLLNRAITLATESANGSVSDSQRVALQAEYSQINQEINSIGSTTDYNGGQVFSTSANNTFLSDGVTSTTIGVTTGTLSAASLGLTPGTITANVAAKPATATVSLTGLPADGDTVDVDGTTYTFKTTLTATADQVAIGSSAATAATNLAEAIDANGTAGTNYGTGTTANANVSAVATGSTVTLTAITAGTAGNAFTLTATGANTSVSGATFAGGAAAGTATTTETNDLSTAADAQATLGLINSAIASVASLRGTLGANVNRLTAASNVITNEVQNLTSAEDGITAADIPQVVANLSQFTILEQSGISALAQANTAQQAVLKLLQ